MILLIILKTVTKGFFHGDGVRLGGKPCTDLKNPKNLSFGAECNINFGFHWGGE